MSLQPESVLVCEGFHDRAFLRREDDQIRAALLSRLEAIGAEPLARDLVQ